MSKHHIRMDFTPYQRLLRDVARVYRQIDFSGDCHIWKGTTAGNGYGTAFFNGKAERAHRITFMVQIGPIPEGMELDHLCRNTLCVNPRHLEPVSHRENMQRGSWSQRTNCPQGHPYDAKNTIWRRGTRKCRECDKRRKREDWYRKYTLPRLQRLGQVKPFEPESSSGLASN